MYMLFGAEKIFNLLFQTNYKQTNKLLEVIWSHFLFRSESSHYEIGQNRSTLIHIFLFS